MLRTFLGKLGSSTTRKRQTRFIRNFPPIKYPQIVQILKFLQVSNRNHHQKCHGNYHVTQLYWIFVKSCAEFFFSLFDQIWLCQTVTVKTDQDMSIIPSCICIKGHILQFLQCKLLRINRL